MEEKKRIVIAEDNEDLCEILETILEKEGYEVDSVHNGFSLISYLKKEQDIDVIILDLIMPEKGGISIFDTIRSISPASKIIIYTGYTNYRHSVFAREADAFICKVEGPEVILETLKRLLN
ncbi:MAG: response regulator [Candidatus Omnitrophota bacterium]